MRIVYRGLVAAALVCALSAGVSFTALADDFVKECKIGTPVPDHVPHV